MKATINFPVLQDCYNVIRYPGGETQIRIAKEYVEPIKRCAAITIRARVATAQDLIDLVLLADAIHGCSDADIALHLPYLPYGRADRRFVPGDCFGLKAFLAILDTAPFKEVLTLDAHSNVSSLTSAKITHVSPRKAITDALLQVESHHGSGMILFPDEGARNRYGEYSWPVAYATKKRNAETGALEGFNIPIEIETEPGPILIVDDICDGGGTFIGIAKQANLLAPGKMFLYVTHGIFSKGYDELGQHFERIFTTNSVRPEKLAPAAMVTQYDAFEVMENA